MLDQKQLKSEGLRFALTLQVAVRTAAMLSVDHAIALRPVEQSFDTLLRLLKQTRELTFGFIDERIMLNNILTTDSGLKQLQAEFYKRGVGAVKFELGITLARFKQFIGLLCTPIKVIEEQGGARAFVARNQLEGLRIFPISPADKMSDSGDTLLEMNAEAFLLSRDAAPGSSVSPTEAMGMLFESAGLEKVHTVGSPSDIMSLIAPTLEGVFTDQHANPEKAYIALAQLLKGVQADVALAAFAPERRQEVSTLPPEQMAAELMEDSALNWAGKYIASASWSTDAYLVEEHVVRGLARSLRAFQMSERLAAKLAKFIKDYALPANIREKIQDELRWVALPPSQKHAKLLQVLRYSGLEFRRLMDHLKELLRNALIAEATELATHYFVFLDRGDDEIQSEELSRAPELISAMAGVRTGFARNVADKLIEPLQREALSEFKHFQLVNALAVLAKTNAIYEDFELVEIVGSVLEHSNARDSKRHAGCCAKALENLLPSAAVERLLEFYLQKRDDSAWARNIPIMLRRAGALAIEIVFQRLDQENTAGNRLALLRLLGRTGAAGIEVARRRLADTRWYVVRNACVILSELKDPDLVQQLTPILKHVEERVQKAAIDAIIRNRDPQRAQIFAAVLPCLGKQLQESVLDELLFLKDPATLPDLERFVIDQSGVSSGALRKASQAIAAVPDDRNLEVLARILNEPTVDLAARRFALDTLTRHRSQLSRQLLTEFVKHAPNDPLAAEFEHSSKQTGNAPMQ